MNAPKTNIEAQCASKGMRMTEQRRIIARVLADSADHPESRRTGDDRQEEELPARRARLEGVEEREHRDDRQRGDLRSARPGRWVGRP